jgi:hypothetical protein
MVVQLIPAATPIAVFIDIADALRGAIAMRSEIM